MNKDCCTISVINEFKFMLSVKYTFNQKLSFPTKFSAVLKCQYGWFECHNLAVCWLNSYGYLTANFWFSCDTFNERVPIGVVFKFRQYCPNSFRSGVYDYLCSDFHGSWFFLN